jgi:hypothetical protein
MRTLLVLVSDAYIHSVNHSVVLISFEAILINQNKYLSKVFLFAFQDN